MCSKSGLRRQRDDKEPLVVIIQRGDQRRLAGSRTARQNSQRPFDQPGETLPLLGTEGDEALIVRPGHDAGGLGQCRLAAA